MEERVAEVAEVVESVAFGALDEGVSAWTDSRC